MSAKTRESIWAVFLFVVVIVVPGLLRMWQRGVFS